MTRTIAWVIGSIALAAALIWGAWWWKARTTAVPAPPPATQAPESAPAATVPAPPAIEHPIERAQAEPGTPPQVKLDGSDSALSDALASLFKGRLPEFVQPTNLIRNIVATIDNLPRSKVAPPLLPLQTTRGALSTAAAGDDLVLAADNSARYAPAIALVEAVDTKQLVAIYVRFYPLFQQAYRELGYPDGYFNDRLVTVIDHLLATPSVKTPIALVQSKVLYQFADPQLEALSAGQKALIRVGPEHVQVLKAKLREIRQGVTGSGVAR